MAPRYLTLSLAEITADFAAIAEDTRAVFGALDAQQLNWRPDASKWSVAQCFDHLLNANREMFGALDAAVNRSGPVAFWQRLPGLPGFFGKIMVKSMMPETTRKFTAPSTATPSTSAIDAQIVQRFIAYQDEAVARVRAIENRDLERLIMVSPFVVFITYSAIDGLRLIVAHQRRHFEQARRVTEQPGFPGAGLQAGVR